MFNQLNDDSNFAYQLRRLPQRTTPLEVGHWLHYWNDADSLVGNLRKLEHWLQRARQDVPLNG